jgi:TIR domain
MGCGVTSREVGLMVDSAAPVPGRIFISYRREETAYPAGWLYDRLADRYRGQVFKDVDSIQLGDDFVEVISRAVGSCDVLLALVGDEWLTITDADGRRRLDDADDFVRLEIEAALTRNVRVIPILVDGAMMPRADELPPSLAGLVRRQALELSPARFDFYTSRLLKVLDRTLAEVRTAHEAVAASSQEPKAPDQSATELHPAPASGSDTPTTESDTPVEPNEDPEYTAALAAYFTERWDTSVDLLTRVVGRYPEFRQATDRLAEARRQQQLAGWDIEARQAVEQGRWDAAVAALERIAAAQPGHPDIARRLEQARTQQRITGLQADLRRMHAARQWTAVIAIGEQLAELDRRLADPDWLVTAAQAELAEAALADRYNTGLRQLDRGERGAAADTFAAIEAERPGYRDAAALLAQAHEDQPGQTTAEQQPPPPQGPAPHADRQPRFRRRWLWAGAAAAIAAVFVIVVIARTIGDNSTDLAPTTLDPPQLVPESGPPGTTVELSGECTPLPDGWSNRAVSFGAGDVDDEGGGSLPSDGSWQGQLRVPDGTPPGTYQMWAGCWGDNADGQTRQYLVYSDAVFEVTEP